MSEGHLSLCGVLLAAGSAKRYGRQKLLEPLPDGTVMAVASLRALKAVLPRVVAVVRKDDTALADQLLAGGAEVVIGLDADQGLGHSLATGVRAAADAAGWLISLADLPQLRSSTVTAVAEFLSAGVAICQPVHADARGHPVGFARRFYAELIALTGDQGARSIIAAHADELELFECDDAGCVRDIDFPGDMASCDRALSLPA